MRESNQIVLKPEASLLIKSDRCPVCALPKHKWKRRKDWTCCSTKCTKFFYDNLVIATSWNDLRIQVFIRDNNQCKMCGKVFCVGDLICDHITPIAVGGLQWDINNLQTLCIWCNKIKTKEDMHRIAKFRRNIKYKSTPEQKQQMLKQAIQDGDLI